MINDSQRKLALEQLRDHHLSLSDEILNILSDDPEFIIEAVRIDWRNIRLSSNKLLNDKVFAMKVLSISNGGLFRFFPESVRSDKECTLKALCMSPFNLAYTTEELRADKDVIIKAIKTETCFNSDMYSSPSFNMASKELKEDESVLEIMRRQIQIKIAQAETHERNY